MVSKLHAYKRISVKKLTPAEHNPRTHSDAQIEQLRASIREFGFTNPLLVDEHGQLIAGHGRLAAAMLEGYVDLPAIVVEGLSDAQKRALVIADNQLALNAGWDAEMLKSEIEFLTEDGFNLDLIGFNDAQLSAIIADPTPMDIDTEWQGMPEFKQDDKSAFRTLIVHFADQAGVDAFIEKLSLNITGETKYCWYPREERMVHKDLRFISDTE